MNVIIELSICLHVADAPEIQFEGSIEGLHELIERDKNIELYEIKEEIDVSYVCSLSLDCLPREGEFLKVCGAIDNEFEISKVRYNYEIWEGEKIFYSWIGTRILNIKVIDPNDWHESMLNDGWKLYMVHSESKKPFIEDGGWPPGDYFNFY